MSQFYVTLPSNSSEEYYGIQPLCNYRTRLAKPVDLNVDEWEVGLAEIIYPHTWKNMTDITFRVKMIEDDRWQRKVVTIPGALYNDPDKFITLINNQINDVLGENQQNKIHFVYNELTRKVSVCLENGYGVILKQPLNTVMGFGDNEECDLVNSFRNDERRVVREDAKRLFIDDDKITSPFVMDLHRGLHTFFVYCDIVEPQLVGDVNVPLLRSVAIKGQDGEVVSKSFDNIHYIGLGRSTFQDIEIHITDDTGTRVPFEYGRVIVKLHFRQK